MIRRRTILAGLGGVALAVGGYATGAYRASMDATERRLTRRSSVIDTTAGALEYAVAGRGAPLLMIHGTGGGFDQGLLFAHRLRELGFQIIAPSRLGYLQSAFPKDAWLLYLGASLSFGAIAFNELFPLYVALVPLSAIGLALVLRGLGAPPSPRWLPAFLLACGLATGAAWSVAPALGRDGDGRVSARRLRSRPSRWWRFRCGRLKASVRLPGL